MPIDLDVGVCSFQQTQQGAKSLFLLWRPSVFGRMAIPFSTPDVAHPYAVIIVLIRRAMCAHLLDGPSEMDASVEIHYIVIPYAAELSTAVPSVDVLHCEVSAFRCCGTMHDNLIDYALVLSDNEFVSCFHVLIHFHVHCDCESAVS